MESLSDVLAALFTRNTLFERSEFVILANALSRQVITLENPNDEAVEKCHIFFLAYQYKRLYNVSRETFTNKVIKQGDLQHILRSFYSRNRSENTR